MKKFISYAQKLATKNGGYVYIFQLQMKEITEVQELAILKKAYLQSPPTNGTMKSWAIKIEDIISILDKKAKTVKKPKKKNGKKKGAKKEAAKDETVEVEDSNDLKKDAKKEDIPK